MLTLEVPLEFIASHIMIIGFEIFLAYIYHSQCSSSIICIFHMVTNIHTYISEWVLKRSRGAKSPDVQKPRDPKVQMPWGQKTQKRSKIIILYLHSVCKHSLYGTVKFTATYLKCVSLLDFSLRAAWAGREAVREKSSDETQQQILQQQTNVPY